jgi:hypothetical protein
MLKKLRLDGGLNSFSPESDISENCASLLRNLQVGIDGRLLPCPTQAYQAIPSAGEYTFEKIWLWTPSKLPTGCYDPHVFIIAQASKNIRMIYRLGTSTWTQVPLGTLSSITSIRVDSSPEMFVFVNGREQERARKITIGEDGVPTMSNLGATQPTSPPIARKITCDPTKDEQFTGMPIGSILMYCYCVVNKWGEKSNPSPITVVDTAQWMTKEEAETNGWIQKNTGSIKSVEIECQISDNHSSSSIHLYRTSAQYVESGTPVPLMQLVAIRDIGDADQNIVTVSDVNFPAEITPDYESDPAPAADAISIADSKIFLANAADQGTFLYPANQIYRITIQNNNPIEYVNRWFRLALLDSTAPTQVRLTDETITLGAASRIVDTDRITCLLSYYSPGGTIKDPGSGATCNVVHELWVRIPLVPMNSAKDIYLVNFRGDPGAYGEPPASGSLADMLDYEDHVQRNPVRDEWTMLCMGKKGDAEIIGSPIGDTINKANTDNQYAWSKAEFTEITDNGIVGSTAPANAGIRIANKANELIRAFYSTQAKPEGFIYGTTIKTSLPSGAVINIAELLGYFIRLEYVNGISDPCLTITRGIQGCSIPLPGLDTADTRIYLAISSNELSGSILDVNSTCSVFYKAVGGQIQHTSYDIALPRIDDGTYDHIEDAPATSNPIEVSYAYQYYASKGYKLNRYNASQLMQHLPLFPTQPCGLCGYTEVSGYKWITSHNVTITKISTQSQAGTDPVGLIRWGSGGAFPQLSEFPSQESILKIAPLKSFADTDEHNTMMLWTSSGKLMRLALLGNGEVRLITEIEGIGRINPETLCRTPQGLAWATAREVFLFSETGLKNLTNGRISIASNITTMFYMMHRKKIAVYAPGSSNILMYDLVSNTWHSESLDYGQANYGGSMQSTDFYISRAQKKIAPWNSSGAQITQTLSTKRLGIPTRISRIRVNGTSASSIINLAFTLYGDRYNSTGTPSQIIPMNSFVAVQGIGYASKGIKITLTQNSAINSIEDIDLEISDEN